MFSHLTNLKWQQFSIADVRFNTSIKFEFYFCSENDKWALSDIILKAKGQLYKINEIENGQLGMRRFIYF